MSLSEAISQNASTAGAAQLTYQQNVATITAAMLAVSEASIPTLYFPPSNWSGFENTFTEAKANAQQWVNDVLSKLLDVPDDVDNNNSVVTQILTACSNYAKQLEQQPDSTTIQALNTDLSTLSTQLGLVTTYISSCQSAVSSFNDQLPALVEQLMSLVTDFTNQENVDQAQVNALQTAITQLNGDIAQQEQNIVTEGILAGAALYIGYISGWTPVGFLVKVLCTATVAAAAYGIDLAANTIASDTAQISSDTQNMNEYTQDAAACMAQVTSFSNLVSQMSAVATSLENVLQQWTTFESEIKTAVAEVSQATQDTSSAQYAAVLTDLQNASNEWTSVDELAVSLQLTLNATEATLQSGMTPQQVQAAVQSAPSQDVISYLNSMPAAA